MPEADWIARVVASLSLVVSFVSLIISWRVAARDNPKLKIRCRYLPESGLGVGFVVSVVNFGRRPLTIDDVFLIDREGQSYSYRTISMRSAQFRVSLPWKLEETEKADYMFPLFHIHPGPRDPRKYKYAGVRDTLGRIRKVSLRKVVRGIPNDIMFVPKDKRPSSEGF